MSMFPFNSHFNNTSDLCQSFNNTCLKRTSVYSQVSSLFIVYRLDFLTFVYAPAVTIQCRCNDGWGREVISKKRKPRVISPVETVVITWYRTIYSCRSGWARHRESTDSLHSSTPRTTFLPWLVKMRKKWGKGRPCKCARGVHDVISASKRWRNPVEQRTG